MSRIVRGKILYYNRMPRGTKHLDRTPENKTEEKKNYCLIE